MTHNPQEETENSWQATQQSAMTKLAREFKLAGKDRSMQLALQALATGNLAPGTDIIELAERIHSFITA